MNPHFNVSAHRTLDQLDRAFNEAVFNSLFLGSREARAQSFRIEEQYRTVFFQQFPNDEAFNDYIEHAEPEDSSLAHVYLTEIRALLQHQESPALAMEYTTQPPERIGDIPERYKDTFLKPYQDFLSALTPA